MKQLIIGLGNPGAEYLTTRHNAGFMAVDLFAGPDAKWKREHSALIAKDGDIIFAKPQTFMNNSGAAVLALMSFYKIPLSSLTVIHDDMDIPLGEVREKVGGGSAGHNGIKSIDAAIGNNYKRIRIGVGHPDNPHMDPADWVLSKFSSSELDAVISAIEKI